MPQDPYVILEINRDASQAEILEAYKAKRSFYQAHVFDEGEAGATAARKLEELDQAYQLAMEASHETATVSDENDSFGYSDVKTLIKNKKFDEAQRRLDDITLRDGEWHYYQAIIFYEKSWLNESKRQLEMALAEDPNNEKYKRSLENLKRKIDGTNAFEREKSGTNYSGNVPPKSYSQNADVADGICTACQALWCADCCCECMGGDLIRCC